MNYKKKIFLVAYGGGHFNIILNIYKFLTKHYPYCKLYVFPCTSAIPQCINENINFLSYTNFISKKRLDFYNKKYKKISTQSHNINLGLDFKETLAYIGANIDELTNLYGDKYTNRQLKIYGRHAFIPFNFMKKVLNKIKPDLVVATNSPKTEYASVIAAKSLGIKTLTIDDLFGHSFLPLNSDIVCANSPSSIPNLIRSGSLPKNIVVTGNPVFDNLFKLRKKFIISNSKKKLVFLSQTAIKNLNTGKFLFFNNTFIENVILSIKKYCDDNNFDFYIRTHPNQSKTIFNKILDKNPNLFKFDDANVLIKSFSKNTHYISFNSTSLYEAYLANKYVSELNISDIYETLGIFLSNKKKYVKVKESGVIKNIKFLKNNNDLLDGNNTKRVVENIIKLIKK
tara:strand:- start:7670 stop:8863 length:1194 start_codon:yes stop_codon:yes gene_type:complete